MTRAKRRLHDPLIEFPPYVAEETRSETESDDEFYERIAERWVENFNRTVLKCAGYDDVFYHEHVIPAMLCSSCNRDSGRVKTENVGVQTIETKHLDSNQDI